ncbi:MAG TPA: retropepsin-like aspartic protease [Chthoniobacterales bacterium]|nr:retropepsin-like aspartic protease [Chthoniobacterales bacterium]
MRSSCSRCSFFITVILLSNASTGHGAVKLDPLGLYLTKNGYGGAQLVHPANFYDLPIQSNSKPGSLLVDTGSPTSLIFRSSLRRLNLIESKTTKHTSGAFGRSHDVVGQTTINALTAGNCTLTNVPVEVTSGSADDPFSRVNSDGLFGLRELFKFGAVLDLHNRLVYLTASRRGNVGAEIKSILLKEGYTPVPLSVTDSHLRVAGAFNGVPCHFVVDTGAYLTALDSSFAGQAKLHVESTPITARGFGGSSRVELAILSSLRIGNYELRRASISILHFDPDLLRRGTGSQVAGLVGVEYLAINSAVFDFNTSTVYLRPRSRLK